MLLLRKAKKIVKRIVYFVAPNLIGPECYRIQRLKELMTGKDGQIAVFTHRMGGGSEKYIQDRIACGDFQSDELIFVYSMTNDDGYYVEKKIEDKTYRFYSPTADMLMKELGKCIVNEILVNNLFEFRDIGLITGKILEFKKKHSTFVKMLIHDYYCICDNVHLYSSTNGYYCGMKNCEECKDRKGNISAWRSMWKAFLSNCDEVIAFSYDSKIRLLKIYDDLPIDVVPHVSSELRKANVNYHGDRINVAILGDLSEVKGERVVAEIASKIRELNLNIKLLQIGRNINGTIEGDDIYEVYGKYDRSHLPEIVEEYNIEIILILSVIPETFSYTTQEAIMLGLPVICFNLGAQAEQIQKYEKGILVDKIDAVNVIESILAFRGKGGA